MIQRVFAVYDSKAEAYLQPFFCPTVGMALRSWEQAAQNPQTDFHQYAGDYTLFEIGTYNDQTGEMQPMLPAFQNHGTALSMISKNIKNQNVRLAAATEAN